MDTVLTIKKMSMLLETSANDLKWLARGNGDVNQQLADNLRRIADLSYMMLRKLAKEMDNESNTDGKDSVGAEED